MKYILLQGHRYYLYDTFETKEEAMKTIKWYKKRNKKNKYHIIPFEGGFLFPKIKYALYMNKVTKIW